MQNGLVYKYIFVSAFILALISYSLPETLNNRKKKIISSLFGIFTAYLLVFLLWLTEAFITISEILISMIIAIVLFSINVLITIIFQFLNYRITFKKSVT